MGSVAGLLTELNAQPNDLVGEFQEAVLARHARGINTGSVLFALMAKLANEAAEDTEFNWWERDPVRRTVYASASALVGATSVSLDDGAGNSVWPLLHQHTIIKNDRTQEYIRVTADPTTDSVSIARGFAGTTAAAINDNDSFSIITQAREEGSTALRSEYEEPEVLQNYCQIFNRSIAMSNSFKSDVIRTDSEGPLRERRIQSLERIGNDIELAYLFGRKARVQGTQGYVWYTGGIIDVVDKGAPAANVLNGQGATGITFSTFNAWLQSALTQGSDAKLLLAGPNVYAAISSYANSAVNGYRTGASDYVFGMNIQTIQTPYGEISLAAHPLMKQIKGFNDWGVLVDLGFIVQKVKEPLFLEENIQANGQDAYMEQYRAKLGLKAKFAASMAYVYNFQKLIPETTD